MTWVKVRYELAMWELVDQGKIVAEVEGVTGRPNKPTCYRVVGQSAEIAPDLETAKAACLAALGL